MSEKLIFKYGLFANLGNDLRVKLIIVSSLEVIKLFSCSSQLSTKFILLINVKMPTIVGLTFICMINTTCKEFKARNFFICCYFSFYEQLKFHAQLSMKKVL